MEGKFNIANQRWIIGNYTLILEPKPAKLLKPFCFECFKCFIYNDQRYFSTQIPQIMQILFLISALPA